MNSRIGLSYIAENKEYILKLATALDTNSVTVKKHVFELLSALCVYSQEGYDRSLETLEYYKEKKCERYRLKVIVDELKNIKTVEYQTVLVTFVNCLITSALSIKEQIRIRNEFIGLKLLEVFSDLRSEYLENGRKTKLCEQLDVFDKHHADEGQLIGLDGVDLNCHLDVFYAILRQVAETPQEVPFLNILQHLLCVDSSQLISDIIWATTERLVHRATLLESKKDLERLLLSCNSYMNLNKLRLTETCCKCSCHKREEADWRTRKWALMSLSLDGCRTPDILSSTCTTNPVFSLPLTREKQQTVTSLSWEAPLPPPPLSNTSVPPPPPPLMPLPDQIVLPQQETPKPKNKMRTLNWNKIPSNKVVGKKNLWTLVARTHNSSLNNMDFEIMEALFCQQSSATINMTSEASPGMGVRNVIVSWERKRKETQEVNLLDSKRSLNINIFVKQFRCSNKDIVEIIRQGAHEEMGVEKLRCLLKVLPQPDEVKMLREFLGDRQRLGNAEDFLMELIQLPSYRLRVESMVLKEEFRTNMNLVKRSIESVKLAAQEIKVSHSLHEILYMILVAGNFLNAGGYAGRAAGFKMRSLLKLTDIRANKPGMNLIHYVAMQVEKKDPTLVKFSEELPSLEEATKVSIDNMKVEVTNLRDKVTIVSTQVMNADSQIQEQMEPFLKIAEEHLTDVLNDIDFLEIVLKI
ncbi:inverted formin-2-like isoform X3 [Tachypleus tridentatus]|uniref:inverted formin-2-like isoform X3 n=1 Tax=Tachypleus tridentatus TaxID=6853 RepID=UPI003FD3404E